MIVLKNISIITAMIFLLPDEIISIGMKMNVGFSWANTGDYIFNVNMNIGMPGIQ